MGIEIKFEAVLRSALTAIGSMVGLTRCLTPSSPSVKNKISLKSDPEGQKVEKMNPHFLFSTAIGTWISGLFRDIMLTRAYETEYMCDCLPLEAVAYRLSNF